MMANSDKSTGFTVCFVAVESEDEHEASLYEVKSLKNAQNE